MSTERKKGSWFSRGKLLLTGEYMVLHGATALALPLRYGQGLEWNGYRSRGGDDHARRTLEWSTFVRDKEWLKAVFGITDDGYVVKSSSHEERAGFLLEVLNAAAGLTDIPLPAGKAESSVGFDMGWGFGSSSTLISNIAWMFDINPFALHFVVSRGSGYDIACARSDTPITYRLQYGKDPWTEAADKTADKNSNEASSEFPVPVYRNVVFNPPFGNCLYFAYTGRKQDSARSVTSFLSPPGPAQDTSFQQERQDAFSASAGITGIVRQVTDITGRVLEADNIDVFTDLLREHDRVVAPLVDEEHPLDSQFRDLHGYVKPLGAWGGDFVMIVWKDGRDELKEALRQKGIDIIFSWDELIVSANGKK